MHNTHANDDEIVLNIYHGRAGWKLRHSEEQILKHALLRCARIEARVERAAEEKRVCAPRRGTVAVDFGTGSCADCDCSLLERLDIILRDDADE